MLGALGLRADPLDETSELSKSGILSERDPQE